MLSIDSWLLAVEGTSRSRVLAFTEGAGRTCSDGARTSVSKADSCLEVWRPVDRFPESGSGKVPIPLSNVLIWQQDSKIIGKLCDGVKTKVSLVFKDSERVYGKKGYLQGKVSRKEKHVAFSEYAVTSLCVLLTQSIYLTEYKEIPP